MRICAGNIGERLRRIKTSDAERGLASLRWPSKRNARRNRVNRRHCCFRCSPIVCSRRLRVIVVTRPTAASSPSPPSSVRRDFNPKKQCRLPTATPLSSLDHAVGDVGTAACGCHRRRLRAAQSHRREREHPWEMSYSDGARPTRKFGTKSPKKLCVTKSENGDKTTTTVNCSGHHHHNHFHHNHHRFLDGSQPSVHKRNLYLVSFPLILLFNVLRTLLYQLFVVFRYLYTSTSQLIQRRQASKQACQLEIVVGQKPTDGLSNRLINGNQVEGEALSQMPRRPIGPGPADPLLAKQKHHHRRAFEFISKALKIDEDNEGTLFTHAYIRTYMYIYTVSYDFSLKFLQYVL